MTITRLITVFQERKIFRVAGLYAAIGFALLQLADILLPVLDLPDVFISYLAIGIVVGFPLVILATWFLTAGDSEKTEHPTGDASVPATGSHLPAIVSTAIVIAFLFTATGYFWIEQEQQSRLDYEEALVEIDRLLEKGLYADAYLVMRDLDVSDDPRRDEYAERVVVPGTPMIAEDEVSVSFKPHTKQELEWTPLGVSPFTEAVPLPRGNLLLKLEAPDGNSRELVVKNPGPLMQNGLYLSGITEDRFDQSPIPLTPKNLVDDGFQLIPASNQPVFLAGWSRDVLGLDIVVETPEFLVQTFEVSNREFREFVLAGGYSKPDFWTDIFAEDGSGPKNFNEAMSEFVDQTGRPGPSTWSLSSYQEGKAEWPVGGISWYEAMAYARFREMDLPTVYQWTRFAQGPLEGFYPVAGAVEESSHFNAVESISADSRTGLGPWSTYNSAGNVREWVLNSTTVGLGIVQGSFWESYGNYGNIITAPKMNRHKSNGVRLVKNTGGQPDANQLSAINLVFDDPYTEREPVSDDAFAVMRAQFTAPAKTIESDTVERLQTTDLWTIDEHVVMYSDEETLTIYVFKPASSEPFKTVLFAPPGNAYRPGLTNRAAIPAHLQQFEYVLRGGRAVVLPIWENTYERFSPRATDTAERLSDNARDAVQWYRDAKNAIEFINTAPDLSADDLTYMAISYGAAVFGQLVTALVPEITNSVFISGGIVHTTKLNPLLDGINYLPRITKPVLVLNGDQDHLFKWENSSVRTYELLGTPAEHKKLIRYKTGHISFSRDNMIRDISDWLDVYSPL